MGSAKEKLSVVSAVNEEGCNIRVMMYVGNTSIQTVKFTL
jgi:hypothetical protein